MIQNYKDEIEMAKLLTAIKTIAIVNTILEENKIPKIYLHQSDKWDRNEEIYYSIFLNYPSILFYEEPCKLKDLHRSIQSALGSLLIRAKTNNL